MIKTQLIDLLSKSYNINAYRQDKQGNIGIIISLKNDFLASAKLVIKNDHFSVKKIDYSDFPSIVNNFILFDDVKQNLLQLTRGNIND